MIGIAFVFYTWLSDLPYSMLPRREVLDYLNGVIKKDIQILITPDQSTEVKLMILEKLAKYVRGRGDKRTGNIIGRKHVMLVYVDWLMANGCLQESEYPLIRSTTAQMMSR